MLRIRLLGSFLLCLLISPATFAQETPAWEKEAAQREIDGMRHYAWVVSDAIADRLKQSPAEDFPAIHAFLQDFATARQGIDPKQSPRKWKAIDVDALALGNPNYWAAVYEIEPAAPIMLWLHATLYAVNGQVAPTLYSQIIAIHSPIETPQKKEMSRLIISSSRLMTMGEKAVRVGVELHDKEEYVQAAEVFRDVLSVIPSHSLALYELGNTLRAKDQGKAGRAAAQAQFDRAKHVDPFRIEAY